MDLSLDRPRPTAVNTASPPATDGDAAERDAPSGGDPLPRRLSRPSGRRVDLTGFDSPLLTRAIAIAAAVAEIEGRGLLAGLRRLRAGLARLWILWAALPSVVVPLSDRPEGLVLRQQLGLRENGRLRQRRAQGVLFQPETFATYLRGRHRQAVRTNVRRAREQGLTTTTGHHEDWSLDPQDPRSRNITAAARLDVFHVNDADGERVGEALVTIDERVALLHMAVSKTSYARWLLHAAIVEHLCGRCELLITNTPDVPLMSDGARHYQRLTGYSIVRLRLASTRAEIAEHPITRLACLALIAGLIMLADHWTVRPALGMAVSTPMWVATLIALHRAAGRSGPAALTSTTVAAIIFCTNGLHRPLLAAGYVVAGAVLDALLARLPRALRPSMSAATIGVGVALLLLLFSELGPLISQGFSALPPGGLITAVALWGALAGVLGWRLGRWFRPMIWNPSRHPRHIPVSPSPA